MPARIGDLKLEIDVGLLCPLPSPVKRLAVLGEGAVGETAEPHGQLRPRRRQLGGVDGDEFAPLQRQRVAARRGVGVDDRTRQRLRFIPFFLFRRFGLRLALPRRRGFRFFRGRFHRQRRRR